MEFLLGFSILSFFVVLGHSLPHNWRYSNPSYHSYSSKRWGYNPYRHYSANRWGYNPYRYHYKTYTKGYEKDSSTVEPSTYVVYLAIFKCI